MKQKVPVKRLAIIKEFNFYARYALEEIIRKQKEDSNMKLTEVKYSRRFNIAQYEHEEISVTVTPDETETLNGIVTELKAEVLAAQNGEETKASIKGEEAGTKKKAAKKTAKKVEEVDEEEDEEEAEETESDDSEGDSSEEEDEEGNYEESEEESEEDEEEEVAPAKKSAKKSSSKSVESKAVSSKTEKKTSASPTTTASGKKAPKKKAGSNYQRSNEVHKKLVGEMLTEALPGWGKDAAKKARAKEVSAKLDGQEFLDENGDVISSFKTAFMSLMKPKKKA